MITFWLSKYLAELIIYIIVVVAIIIWFGCANRKG